MSDTIDPSAHEPVAGRRKAFGRALAELREAHRVSVAQIAAATGVTEQKVARWERGTADMTFEAALAIEDLLGEARGTLGGLGTYFGFEATPACDETWLSERWISRFDDLIDQVKAARRLGLGVRMRNQRQITDSGPDWDESTEHWVLELLADAPVGSGAVEA